MATMKTALLSVNSCYRFPIIVILGSTGVGKTRLSIELAKKLNGEIVSADSMQVYRGLDIITAKATVEERMECKHHMIDIIDPLENFSVVQYRDMALPIIEDISNRGKLPIIVGGTNYYIESILWDILVSDVGEKFLKKTESSNHGTSQKNEKFETKTETAEKNLKREFKPEVYENCENAADLECKEKDRYYQQLMDVDPRAASRIHPNDVRKVKRQLEIRELTGRLPSEIISEQHSREGADHLGGPLRFTNALVFWLTCEQIALEKRLCHRIEEMLENGLMDEISNFYREYNESISKRSCDLVPYSEGIFQAIGFKEFHLYLTKQTGEKFELEKLFQEGIEMLKRTTIRYSKKQKTWVRNRFLKRPLHSSPNVYELDTSVVEKYNEAVLQPALKAAEHFLRDEKLDIEPLARQPRDPDDDAHKQFVCEACGDKLIVGDSVWKKHCDSRKHRKRVAKKRKLKNSSGS